MRKADGISILRGSQTAKGIVTGWAKGNTSTAGLALFYLVVLIVFSVLSPQFRTEDNFQNLLIGFSPIAILAIGMSFPIILAGIDLSVGSVVGVVGMVVFDTSVLGGVPGIVVIVIALVVGALLGAFNGYLIVRFRLSPFIVTLAAMAAWRGVTYAISGRGSGGSGDEEFLKSITNGLLIAIDGSVGPIPLCFVYLVLLGIAAWWLMTRTKLGRDLYSVGGNERAAFLAGINVARAKIIAYALSGVGAAVVALIQTSRQSTSPEDLGTGFELSAIAAAVVGGVSLAGGIGGVLGPILGAFLIGTAVIGMQLENVSTYVQTVVSGVILIAAVGYDRYGQVRRGKKASRERERLRPMAERGALVPEAAT